MRRPRIRILLLILVLVITTIQFVSAEENQGLYSDISADSSYVESFEAWAIDPARTVGETGIVETEYGYHIMYFSSYSDTLYRNFLITNDMRTEDAQAWHDDLVAKAAVTLLTDKYVDKGMKLS